MPDRRPIRPIQTARSASSEPFTTAAAFLLHVINDESVVIQVRVKAGIALLAFERPSGVKAERQAAAEDLANGDSPYATPPPPPLTRN